MGAKVIVDRSCPVCDSTDVEIKGLYRGTHPVFSDLKRIHCLCCGMVFAAPMPSDEVLADYNANYFASAHGGHSKDKMAEAFFSGMARLRMSHIELYLGARNLSISHLLEFGPGSGFFARNWLARYPHVSYSACETDTSCHEVLQTMGVHLVEASSLGENVSPVDIVVMSHVMEHVSNPIAFLKDATRNLRMDGALFIEVPCRDWEHKPIDEPHLLFFDKNSMLHLLRRLGFEDIQVSYHGQEIERLRSASIWRSKFMALRSRLISLGVVAPFARMEPGMEALTDPLERAATAPFQAHCERKKPAWWLRAIARKAQ